MKGNYVRLLDALRKRRFCYVGDGRNRRTLIYDEDVAAAALLAAEHPQAPGNVYNVTDGRVHTFHEIVEAMCRALGRRPPRLHVPVSLVRACIAAAEGGLRCLGRKSPVTRKLLDKLVEDVAVSGAKIERELHYRPQVDLLNGWRQVAAADSCGCGN
jgi:UDP-glucose 4-epimerase